MMMAVNRGGTPAPSASSGAGARPALAAPSLRAVVWLALGVRVALFPFAENKHGDAPMRALIVERMNADPVAAWDPRSFCQFGPLPIEVMRPFVAADTDARRSSRVPSLIAGLAALVPFLALGRRMIGAMGPSSGPALALAALALALSPLHVQVSTTAASESIYLLLLLAALERLHAAVSGARRRDFVVAGALMSLAAVTRYDTWVAVPAAAAALLAFGPRRRRDGVNAVSFFVAAAVLPAAYLVWTWIVSGDPFFFGRYITRDHATLARAAVERLGGGVARLRQVGIWAVSFAAAMTPVGLLAAGIAVRGWRAWPPATRVVVVAAVAPIGAYLAKGLLLGDFEPLPRFAIAPGAVLLPLAASSLVAMAARRRWHRLVPALLIGAGAAAIAAVALVLAFAGPGRVWGGAESIGPLTRLDGEDRELAAYLLRNRRPDEGVLIDTGGYADIVVAHAARVPAPRSVTLAQTRDPIKTVAESRRVTAASWFAIHDDSWGRTAVPDWPADSVRFGHWRLAHVGHAP
ncbi:MAG: glycosyltransferase family 39 protein [Pseudomonadota bacterium]